MTIMASLGWIRKVREVYRLLTRVQKIDKRRKIKVSILTFEMED